MQEDIFDVEDLFDVFDVEDHLLFDSGEALIEPAAGSIQEKLRGEVGGWGRVTFSRNLMSPTPRRKWYLTTGRRAH